MNHFLHFFKLKDMERLHVQVLYMQLHSDESRIEKMALHHKQLSFICKQHSTIIKSLGQQKSGYFFARRLYHFR